MVQEIVQIPKNDNLYIDPLTLHHLHFHVINAKI